jgi:hypothetical protein
MEWAGQFNNYLDHKKTMSFEVQFLNKEAVTSYSFSIKINDEGNIVANGNQICPYNQVVELGGNKVIFKKILGNEKWAKGLINPKKGNHAFLFIRRCSEPYQV